MSDQKLFWAKVVLKILKTELAKREIKYGDLKERLALIGIQETESNIKNKLSRGTFSAIFFLQCLRAIGVKHLEFDEAVFKDNKRKSE